jgi:hypothetical protein
MAGVTAMALVMGRVMVTLVQVMVMATLAQVMGRVKSSQGLVVEVVVEGEEGEVVGEAGMVGWADPRRQAPLVNPGWEVERG